MGDGGNDVRCLGKDMVAYQRDTEKGIMVMWLAIIMITAFLFGAIYACVRYDRSMPRDGLSLIERAILNGTPDHEVRKMIREENVRSLAGSLRKMMAPKKDTTE
jgi:hypothetical protein